MNRVCWTDPATGVLGTITTAVVVIGVFVGVDTAGPPIGDEVVGVGEGLLDRVVGVTVGEGLFVGVGVFVGLIFITEVGVSSVDSGVTVGYVKTISLRVGVGGWVGVLVAAVLFTVVFVVEIFCFDRKNHPKEAISKTAIINIGMKKKCPFGVCCPTFNFFRKK